MQGLLCFMGMQFIVDCEKITESISQLMIRDSKHKSLYKIFIDIHEHKQLHFREKWLRD